MLSVYCSQITPRLEYILDFIGRELFDEPVTLTSNQTEFLASKNARLNYSNDIFDNDTYRIKPAPLLFQNDIREVEPLVFEFDKTKALFKTEGDFPFDIFAASFYLITRYEEYLTHTKDKFGRYAHTNSIAFREQFLDQPVINMWLMLFKSSLLLAYPDLKFRRQQFSCNNTYDIDIAYSYLYKGVWRNAGGFVKDFFKGNWRGIDDRWQVLRGKKQDPFDCFEWLDAIHLYCRLKPIYFFLVAKNQARYDKNISTDIKPFRELIEYYASRYEVGIHPSWQSGDNKKLLKEELGWLEVISDKRISSSRQHYIRLNTPETFRTLIEAGITNDFSMGYGSINGFRASVCSPYKWYDLVKNERTDLTINPFCFMDANSFYEQKQNPEQTYLELVRYYDLVKKLNGSFIPIWHNHMLGSDPAFTGWREMFELFMRETVYWDAYTDHLPG